MNVPALIEKLKTIPVAVRPVVFLALLPIAAHLLIFPHSPRTAYEMQRDASEAAGEPPRDLIRNMIEHSNEFQHSKIARCWRWSDLESPATVNVTAPVCRALIDLGYLKREGMEPTEEGASLLGEVSSYSDNVYATVARRRLVSIQTVSPPLENGAYQAPFRVDFLWIWRPTNNVGERLGYGTQYQNMRGAAFFTLTKESTWRLDGVSFKDTSPNYDKTE
jgi:hypothetical protein